MAENAIQKFVRKIPRQSRYVLGVMSLVVGGLGAFVTSIHQEWSVWKVLGLIFFVGVAVICFTTDQAEGGPTDEP